MKRIENKVALVTGAAQGIGRAIALRLANEGADVAIVDLNKEKMDKVAKEVRETGQKATTFKADVSDRDAIFAAVDHAEKELGGFDIMINNAGIVQVKPLSEVSMDDMKKIFQINVNGVMWGIQAAANKFKERGQEGKIINASSAAGHQASAILGVYSATKFAVRALTQAAAQEYGSDGITVNAYAPGIVDTDMWVEIDEKLAKINGNEIGENYKKFIESVALGRAEKPEDVAAFVSYLASPDADYMTGQAPLIDGGIVYR